MRVQAAIGLASALLLLAASARATAAPTVPVPAAPTPTLAVTQPAVPAVTNASALEKRLAAAVAHPDLVGAKLGITVRDAVTGALLFERGGADPLAPASNMKLVTAGAVIELLGPERQLSTRFLADREPDMTGAIGNLYIVGGGDPSLSVENLYGVARILAGLGVRRVSGIVVDDSYFAGTSRPGSWPQRNWSTWYGAPTSALTVNSNLVAVNARASKVGAPISTWVDPFPTFFRVESQLKAGPGALRVRATIVPDETGDTWQAMLLTGRVRAGRAQRVLVPVEDPALFAGHGMAESLQRVGVVVENEPVRGIAPPKAALLHRHVSRPLALLVEDMNKESSNVHAETLLKVLGAEIGGVPGTREKGLEVLKAWLEHVSPAGCACHLEDGSGLSPLARLTSHMVSDVLLLMTRGSFASPEFLVSLPVGGVDGTLRRRFKESSARRQVRAKTGRINNVAALSGLAHIGANREAVFSILLNDYRCPSWKAEDAIDRLVEAMVADAPPIAEPKVRIEMIPDELETQQDDADAPPVEGDSTASTADSAPGEGENDGTRDEPTGGH